MEKEKNELIQQTGRTYGRDELNHILLRCIELYGFVHNNELDDSLKQQLINYVNDGIHNTPVQHYDDMTHLIQKVDDQILKSCYLRSAEHLKYGDDKTLLYKEGKKKYNFDYVFDNTDCDYITNVYVDFLCKRIASHKNACIVSYGLSGSGKSYSTNMILSKMPKPIKYRLSEIYLNKLYVYQGGLKTEVSCLLDSYKFYTDDINGVMNRFQTRMATQCNSQSSRAHCVVELFYDNSIITCVDLCGQERLGKQSKDECIYINKSIYNLTQFLKNGKHRDGKDKLLSFFKGISNIVLNVILHDNALSMASDMLSSISKLL